MVTLASPSPLTRREWEVLLLLAKGKRNREIAQELNVTVRTIKFHNGNIFSKLGLSSRLEAMLWVWEHTQLPGPPEVGANLYSGTLPFPKVRGIHSY